MTSIGDNKANSKPFSIRSAPYKRIKNLTKSEKTAFLNSFDTVFCDCDGVIWRYLSEGIAGCDRAIDYLRKQGKRVVFVTNHSITSTEDQIRKFANCGIPVEKGDVVHPAQTICDYLKSIKFEGLIFCISTKPFKELLSQAGFQLVQHEDRIITESLQDLRSAIYSSDPIKAVIIDVDFNMTAAKLMRAHVHLKNPDCLLIGGAADTLIPFGGGDVIGPGPFINVVEVASKRKAIILGKPGMALANILKKRFNVLKQPGRALFIGDSLSSDIKFGKLCGFQTLLVLTGGTKAADLNAPLTAEETPDYVAESLLELKELM